MAPKLSPRDKNFGNDLVAIIKSHIPADLFVKTKVSHKEPDPRSGWKIEIAVREKTDKERKTEELARKLNDKISKKD